MSRTLEDWEGGDSIRGIKLTNLRYADVTTLVAAPDAGIASLLCRIEEISKDMGRSINRSKTNYGYKTGSCEVEI